MPRLQLSDNEGEDSDVIEMEDPDKENIDHNAASRSREDSSDQDSCANERRVNDRDSRSSDRDPRVNERDRRANEREAWLSERESRRHGREPWVDDHESQRDERELRDYDQNRMQVIRYYLRNLIFRYQMYIVCPKRNVVK
jgi:hypothetical protein